MSACLPEAAHFLHRLLRGLPCAVREVVKSTHLQRNGCVLCGLGPHSTHDCPFLDKEEAEKKAAALFRRWLSLVGEELLLFSRSSSTAAYVEAAHIRFANRTDLPKRPPRRMRCDNPSGNRQAVQEPLLPTPVLNEPPKQLLRQTVKAKPQPAPTMARSKGPDCLSDTVNARNPAIVKAAIAPPKPKAKSPPHNAVPHPVTSQTSNSTAVVSQDLNALCSPHMEDSDARDAAILCSMAKLSRDVEMLQASLLGNRRGREFTPGSADRGRPDKFIRVEETPTRLLDFSTAASAAVTSSSALQSESTSSAVSASAPASSSSPVSQSLGSEYEGWDIERYVQARQFTARFRFWQHASAAAKEKMVRALYDQPSGSPATIQARENGWIPL